MNIQESVTAGGPTEGSDERLGTVHALYRQGLYRRAFEAAAPLGPLEQWRGVRGRVLAGRLAAVLGAVRLVQVLHRLAHREHPGDPLAVYYAARTVFLVRGPWAAWKLLAAQPLCHDDASALRADVAAFRGFLLAQLRDFSQSRRAFDEALRLAPSRPWLHVERAGALALEDRFDEALAAANHSLELQPWNRPGVQAAAHYYRTLGRHRQALELVDEACRRLECGETLMLLADLHESAGDYQAAADATDRAAEHFLLADRVTLERLSAVRSDLAYHLGDRDAAIEFAGRTKSGFHAAVARNLQAAEASAPRAVLEVPFVRQHHLTCAPATLASLARYWGRPAEQLQIAEAICYDGTPAHSERRWAEQAGFTTREFTVDWTTAGRLIDRGVPFTFTTVEATAGHLQAVVGYDACRGTLLLRDPSQPRTCEMLADEGLGFYRGFGPRGMVLVPPEEAGRLEGLALADAPLYDEFYGLAQALERHDRASAQTAYQRMVEAAPTHRLTLNARRTIAAYDADSAAALHALEQWLAQAPECPPLLFAKLCLLRTQAPRAERLPFLEDLARRRDLDPIFRLHWAEELCDDAREHPRARRVLEKLLGSRPLEPRCYFALANITWSAGDFAEATRLYRIAACLDDRQEGPSRQYFLAAQHVKQTPEALDWLVDRNVRLGDKSSQPAQTLFWAYETLLQTEEALAVLDAALVRHPDDDTLPLFAVDAYARYGRFTAAEQLLDQRRHGVHEGAWLRAAASLASARGQLPQALAHWREVAAREPQSAEAADAVARLVEQTEGRGAALACWQQVLERFPHNLALLRSAVSWLREVDPAETERTLDRLLELHPIEPWALRERAVARTAQRRFDEALADAELALILDPSESYGHSVRGRVLSRLGRTSEAQRDYRRALELCVDNESAIHSWLADCRSRAQRAEALAFFYEQLVRQTTFGGGLLAYGELARHVLDGETLLADLRAGLQARPDLWHAASAVVNQLLALERVEEAAELARQMAERFPLIPMAWAEVAQTCRLCGDAAGEIAALEKALEINCRWTYAIFQLVEAHTRQNDLERAQAVIRQALCRVPQVAAVHGYQADLCWTRGQREAALAALGRAVELDPDYSWAWQALERWGAEVGQPELACQTARALVQRRGGEARSWYWLARTLVDPAARRERLEAAERAAALDPHWLDARVLWSRLLAEAGRFDEALAACRPVGGDEPAPQPLRAQQAEVLLVQGRREEAVAQLRALLADNPDYVAGWYQLAAWGNLEPQLEPLRLEAAQQLVRLQPHSCEAWHLLGEAVGQSDRAMAKRAWARALELDPTDRYAAVWLYDLHLADEQHAEAEAVLAAIESRAADPYVWARRVQLATLLPSGDQAAALEALAKLCATDTADPWPLGAALEALARRGWLASAQTVLKRCLDDPQASRYVLAEWISLLLARRRWFRARRALARHAATAAAWNRAAARLVAAWGSNRRPGLPRFVRRHAAELSAEAELWGNVGWALLSRGQHRHVVDWLSGYRNRGGVEPWMLINLAVGLRALGRHAEAVEVHHDALSLPPDHTTPMHRCWLGIDAAVAGKLDEADAHLAAVGDSQLDDFYSALGRLVRATIDGRRQLAAARRPFGWYRIAAALRGAMRPHRGQVLGDRLLARVYSRCLGSLLLAAGYRVTSLWLPWLAGL